MQSIPVQVAVLAPDQRVIYPERWIHILAPLVLYQAFGSSKPIYKLRY